MRPAPLRYHGPGWRLERLVPRPTGVDHEGEEYPEYDDEDGKPILYTDDFVVWAPRPIEYDDEGRMTYDPPRGRTGWSANWQAANGMDGNHVADAATLDAALACFDTYPAPATTVGRIKAAFRKVAAS